MIFHVRFRLASIMIDSGEHHNYQLTIIKLIMGNLHFVYEYCCIAGVSNEFDEEQYECSLISDNFLKIGVSHATDLCINTCGCM